MENLRGSLLMVAAMLGFALEDMFIKLLAGALPVGQILMLLGLGGGVAFALMAMSRGDRLWSPDFHHPAVIARNLGEVIGTGGFITAVALSPLATATAIAQSIPLLVTLGAALFFAEPVGWRRWSAICVGLLGVLIVIRPGADGFTPMSLFALIGAIGLAGRDLASRRVPRAISSTKLSVYAFLILVPVGYAMVLVADQSLVRPDATQAAMLGFAIVIGIAAYYMLTAATRMGEVSVIAPYRYTRLIFALVIAVSVFGERPDGLTYLGAAIIVGSGIYTLLREARVRRASRRVTPAL
ncbi:drug/metabolite transporter (DMT)-like permease [Limimaricola variabilis]|uniref:Drug/metabolite transporter (DMT)-like permease n=1 Tax=Limimaricola variabilis TaxID=1492771 RepID=A0ABR6HKH0_9RHOB|nr:DMT family transporter [Limimaricola variabilis]MBB3710879.1 drug/metabolite transporter (DMT)-like permease [Limimaricola variabilis]WPY95433.1 DMT family transporter [Limimaricola variabilis]